MLTEDEEKFIKKYGRKVFIENTIDDICTACLIVSIPFIVLFIVAWIFG